MIPDGKIHEGHRERMRDKLLTHGARIFHTYELLEMLLYYVIPYKDTNPVAKNLLDRFSSVDGVFSAEYDELLEVAGVGPRVAELICTVGRIAPFEDSGSKSEPFDNYEAVGEYFCRYFEGEKSSSVALMLLDNRMEIIKTVRMYDVDYSSGGVRSESFVSEIIKSNASVAIVAHSHPYGAAIPTEGDVATNNMLRSDVERAGALLLEHYVVSGKRYRGFMTDPVGNFLRDYGVGAFIASREVHRGKH